MHAIYASDQAIISPRFGLVVWTFRCVAFSKPNQKHSTTKKHFVSHFCAFFLTWFLLRKRAKARERGRGCVILVRWCMALKGVCIQTCGGSVVCWFRSHCVVAWLAWLLVFILCLHCLRGSLPPSCNSVPSSFPRSSQCPINFWRKMRLGQAFSLLAYTLNQTHSFFFCCTTSRIRPKKIESLRLQKLVCEVFLALKLKTRGKLPRSLVLGPGFCVSGSWTINVGRQTDRQVNSWAGIEAERQTGIYRLTESPKQWQRNN